jgi:glucan phosphoethanolaminetransferase (alkaline phosphatase superfamily)
MGGKKMVHIQTTNVCEMAENPLFFFAALIVFNLLFGLVFASLLSENEDELLALILPISFTIFAFSTLPSLFFKWSYFPASHLISIIILIVFLFVQKFYRKAPLLQNVSHLLIYLKSNPRLV